MAAPTRTPRSAWIDAGLQALADGGPEAVRVDQLAKALNVSRGGFYWQFADRDALLRAMLDGWERRVIDDVIEHVESAGGDARARLVRLFALASTRRDLGRIELAVRDWARRDRAVARRLKRVDNRRMDYMRGLFGAFCPDPDEVEARCLLVFSLFVASSFIPADHRGRRRSEVVERAMTGLLA